MPKDGLYAAGAQDAYKEVGDRKRMERVFERRRKELMFCNKQEARIVKIEK